MSGVAPADRAWPAFARRVIERATRAADPHDVEPPEFVPSAFGGVFVTLHKFKRLRGCMGTLDTSRPLAEAVRGAAVNAALHDPRFAPVGPGELPDLSIDVSILSAPWRARSPDEIELGRHGIIVRRGARQGLFLPQVAVEHKLDRDTFLSRCCSEKAGLPPDAWRDPETELLLFTTDCFAEVAP